jgi:hypothetical protein
MFSRRITIVVPLVITMLVLIGAGASSALAQCLPPPLPGESHPCISIFGSFTNPNGIAVDESTGDVYVAQLGTSEQQTVSIQGGPEGGGFTLEFKGKKTSVLSVSGTSAPSAEAVQTALRELSTIGPANNSNVTVSEEGALPSTVTYTVSFQGELATVSLPLLACDGSALTGGTSPACTVATTVPGVDSKVSKFDANGNPIESWGTNGTLNGGTTTAGSFAIPNAPGTPAAIAVDNSTNPSDPSTGDLYVMDAGHEVIDKFSPSGAYLGQIASSFSGKLLGLGVDASGNVRVDVRGNSSTEPATDVFDSSPANNFVMLLNTHGTQTEISSESIDGFATGDLTKDDYLLYSCGCMVKIGPDGEELGRVDGGSTGVAAAVDKVTGHLYIDDGSYVAEWDTGAMNGSETSSGTLVSSFGSLPISLKKQGGVAVNGASGDIYVSDPIDGQVDVFASAEPAITAVAPVDVTETGATLKGTVNPRGIAVASCRFEYGSTGTYGQGAGSYSHSVPCEPTPGEGGGQIGKGTQPVTVSAKVTGLQPGTLYHFHLVAGNADGTSLSSGLFPTVAASFGLKSFEAAFLNKDGTPDTQAGSHPYEFTTDLEFNPNIVQREAIGDLRYITQPNGNLKDVIENLPPGFFGDPNATTKKCTLKELYPAAHPLSAECPPESEIGEVESTYIGGTGTEVTVRDPAYSVTPPPGVAFQIASHLLAPNAFIDVELPAGGNSGLRGKVIGAPGIVPVLNTRLTLFGVPPHGATRPLLTLPTSCNGPLTSTLSVDSYQNPGQFANASSVTRNAAGTPGGMSGCAQLEFPPSIEAKPDVSDASSTSGLTVGVHVSQKAAFNPEGLAESGVRDLTVALPAGVAINPADADGLEVCSGDPNTLAPGELGSPSDQIGYLGPKEFNPEFEPGDSTATFTSELANPLQPGTNFCPNGSKIGTVRIKTPLLSNPLEGAVYLAAQEANPFGSLMAMYLVAEDPVSGTIIKQTGKVELCENTEEVLDSVSCEAPGQIVATLKNMPDDPFEEAELHFFGGERSPLRTPSRCGTYTTKASFTPWDGNGPVNTTSSFQITSGPNESPCPGASLPFNPSVNAGSTNIQAGEFSPFTLSFIRHDGEQNVQSAQATLPPGLSGMLSNITLCQEPQANEGACPESSLIGTTTVSVGVGSHPFVVTGGKDYLTGPYNGSGGCTMGTSGCAPFGLTFEIPAKAGPFDFEKTAKHHPTCDCVIVRGKIEINPLTSALTITTNPPGSQDSIPTSLEGIPLEIQQVNATTTRSNFQFNPTSCAKMALVGHLLSSEGAQDTVEQPYQVTNCAALKFEPKLSVSTSGKTSKAKGASLTTKLTYPKVPQGTDADIAKVKVELPKQLPSRLTTLQKACTAKQFEADPAGCPAESKIGYAVVHTPILPVPLVGPAIFVSHGGEAFPSLTMVLQGDGVTIDLVGTTFISKSSVTSTTFKAVPDQPFSSFELTLPEGKYSALTANGNLCSLTKTVTVKKKVRVRTHGHSKTVTRKVKETQPASLTMPAEFVAQNGAVLHQSTKVGVTGCPKAKKHRKRAKKTTAKHKKGAGKKKA